METTVYHGGVLLISTSVLGDAVKALSSIAVVLFSFCHIIINRYISMTL